MKREVKSSESYSRTYKIYSGLNQDIFCIRKLKLLFYLFVVYSDQELGTFMYKRVGKDYKLSLPKNATFVLHKDSHVSKNKYAMSWTESRDALMK